MTVSNIAADGVSQDVAEAWMLIRKAKRLPLTTIAWDGIKAQAHGAGLTIDQAIKTAVENGWAGFKAAWLSGSPQASGGRQQAMTKDERDAEALRLMGFGLDDQNVIEG